ncbi:MAG: hypothetical protein K8I27_12055 [Planctomycetes bacterium]|nr:hypothetical protein [Planctomycetota bacterium]
MDNRKQIRIWLMLVAILVAGITPFLGMWLGGWSGLETMMAVWLELALAVAIHVVRSGIVFFWGEDDASAYFGDSLKLVGLGLFASVGYFVLPSLLDANEEGVATAALVLSEVAMLFRLFTESPALILPALAWAGVEALRLFRDGLRGKLKASEDFGSLIMFPSLCAMMVTVWLFGDDETAGLLLGSFLMVKLGADVFYHGHVGQLLERRPRVTRPTPPREELLSVLRQIEVSLRDCANMKLHDEAATPMEQLKQLGIYIQVLVERELPDLRELRKLCEAMTGAGFDNQIERAQELIAALATPS